MGEFYPYILIIHLFCAIFFIGYLFVDVLILGSVKKKNPDFNDKFFDSQGVRIMPFIVLLLFLSGGALASFHFQSLNLLFVLKMTLAFVILALVIFSLFFHFVLKKPNPLGTLIHPLVFTLCVCIVILAKLMNYLFVAF
ncbi:MAG: copper resistance protein CopD [Helicobacter sp.]|nr:copper resistance protein CopD [Helicobacter sp.]